MKIFNTLTKKKEEFQPLTKGQVKMYVCGPTVYDVGHLGHGRAAVMFDVVRKYFLYKGYEVFFVSNYTDIDDKMIKRASELGISVKELADRIIPEYEQDFRALGVMDPDRKPKATEYIEPIVEMIQKLEEKDFTYVLDDGVYFDVSKYPDYGKLSGQKLDELMMGARVEVKENKKNPQDFALWKFEKPGEPAWDSPWGRGRPGWHIECSAMTWKNLGEEFDIHGGGQDLIFPHHDCEIAQSESALRSRFAKYWMHNGFININQEKMSKSLGNFFTICDILKKYSPPVLRLLYLQTHYRSPIDFSGVLLTQAQHTLQRVQDFFKRLKTYQSTASDYRGLNKIFLKTKQKFEEAMDDDFETPEAFASLFEFIKEMNKLLDEEKLSKKNIQKIYEFIKPFDGILGVFHHHEETLEPAFMKLIEEREQARKRKDWKEADRIRDELKEKGVYVEDTPSGPVWKLTL